MKKTTKTTAAKATTKKTTKTEQYKQIGNSVPVKTAKAMCEADLRQIAKEHTTC